MIYAVGLEFYTGQVFFGVCLVNFWLVLKTFEFCLNRKASANDHLRFSWGSRKNGSGPDTQTYATFHNNRPRVRGVRWQLFSEGGVPPVPTGRVPKWSQNGSKMIPKWSQIYPTICPKGSQKDPKIMPKWPQNDLKMIPKLSEDDPKKIPKLSQSDSKMIPTWCQRESKINSKWIQSDPKLIYKWNRG